MVDPSKPGAKDWIAGDLRYPGGTSTVLGIRLAGHLAGKYPENGDVYCERITGDIVIDALSISLEKNQGLYADEINGDLHFVNGMWGDLHVGALNGDVLVGDTPQGAYTPGEFFIGSSYGGSMHFTDPGGFDGTIKIGGDFTGSLTVDGKMYGDIEIDGDLRVGDANAPGRLVFLRLVDRFNGGQPPNVRIHGSITGASTGGPAIRVRNEYYGGGLKGTIAIDGSLNDVISDGPEMIIDHIQMDDRGAVAVDYDGWDPNDDWFPDARILIGDPNDPNAQDNYYGNNLGAGVFAITPCKGDLTNDGILDAADVTAMGWALLYENPEADPADRDKFVDKYPGRERSIPWHGNLNCDKDPNGIDIVDEFDLAALRFFVAGGDVDCCMSDPDCGQFDACRADLNRSGQVELGDLAALLAVFGSCYDPNDPNDPNFAQERDADINADACVELGDLAALLAQFGEDCGCFPPTGSAPESSGSTGTTIAVVPTGALDYRGDDYVTAPVLFGFDLIADIPAGDDWTTGAAALTAHNRAVFRLTTAPTTLDPLATFVCAPWTFGVDGPPLAHDVELAGSYSPVGPEYVYETDEINIVWYDLVASATGPAAIMHIVIDTADVALADFDGGPGGAYFSQTGPNNAGDIRIADLMIETGSSLAGEATLGISGSIYLSSQ